MDLRTEILHNRSPLLSHYISSSKIRWLAELLHENRLCEVNILFEKKRGEWERKMRSQEIKSSIPLSICRMFQLHNSRWSQLTLLLLTGKVDIILKLHIVEELKKMLVCRVARTRGQEQSTEHYSSPPAAGCHVLPHRLFICACFTYFFHKQLPLCISLCHTHKNDCSSSLWPFLKTFFFNFDIITTAITNVWPIILKCTKHRIDARTHLSFLLTFTLPLLQFYLDSTLKTVHYHSQHV